MKRNWCLGLILLTIAIGQIRAQDVIYKKNGEIIQVFNLATTGKSRSYNLSGDAEGTVRYISINILDSIIYANEAKDIFQPLHSESMIFDNEKIPFNRNSLGFDVAALTFYRNIKISYKYLPGAGNWGFATSFSKNLEPINLYVNEQYDNERYYSNLTRYLRWHVRAGIDAYIFDPGPFRISGGLHWITGKYTTENYQNLEKEPWYILTKETDNSMYGILLSSIFLWQPVDFVQFNVGLDIPLYSSKRFRRSFVGIETLLNF
jgi:hypothetical protein